MIDSVPLLLPGTAGALGVPGELGGSQGLHPTGPRHLGLPGREAELPAACPCLPLARQEKENHKLQEERWKERIRRKWRGPNRGGRGERARLVSLVPAQLDPGVELPPGCSGSVAPARSP